MSGGLVAAIFAGWVVSALSGQAAAQAAEAEDRAEVTLVQADWKVDDVLADMAAVQASREQAAAEAAAKEAEAAEKAAEEAEAAAPWISPSDASISSFYGQRDGRLHGGTDFANNEGDAIRVVGDGTVTYVGFEAGGYGNVVYVDHGNGVETRYAHAVDVPVSVGDELSKGDTVIYAGTTGNSTGPHLHFEVLIDGEKVDSLAWLQEQGVDVG